MKDIIIADRYRVDFKIGTGGFGLVYSGTDLSSGEEVAIKLMYVRARPEFLELEGWAYEALGGGVGIPRMRWFGDESDFLVMVMDALGPSLEDLLNYCGRKFSLKTILLLADQAISRIEYIHSKGFLHRHIKPENFLMGVGRQGNTLYAIDFGFATEFSDVQREGLPRGGTSFFASINNHNGRSQSWGDDLECLGYSLVYFASGSLPWEHLEAAQDGDVNARIKEMKEGLSGEAICDGHLSQEFATYINYTRSLAFGEKPDYAYLRRLFRRTFRAEGFKYDNVFDWTEHLFDKMQSEANPTVLSP